MEFDYLLLTNNVSTRDPIGSKNDHAICVRRLIIFKKCDN